MTIKLEDTLKALRNLRTPAHLRGLHPPEDLLLQLERIAHTLNVRLKWREDEEGNMMAGILTPRGEFWTHLSNYDLNPWHSAFARLGLLDKAEKEHPVIYPVVDPKLPLQNPQYNSPPPPPNPHAQYNLPPHKQKVIPATHHADPRNAQQTLCGKWNIPFGLLHITPFGKTATCVDCERKRLQIEALGNAPL